MRYSFVIPVDNRPDEVRERRKAAGQDPQLGYANYDRHLSD